MFRQIIEEVARTNGRLDVLGLAPSEQDGEGERVRLQSGLASDDPNGKTPGVGLQRGRARYVDGNEKQTRREVARSKILM